MMHQAKYMVLLELQCDTIVLPIKWFEIQKVGLSI